MILGCLYDIAPWQHPWPWPWSFKVRVWNCYISGMGWPIDMERKGWVIHSWPWYWLVWPWWGGRMYLIVTSACRQHISLISPLDARGTCTGHPGHVIHILSITNVVLWLDLRLTDVANLITSNLIIVWGLWFIWKNMVHDCFPRRLGRCRIFVSKFHKRIVECDVIIQYGRHKALCDSSWMG